MIASPVTVRSQSGHDDWFDSVVVSVLSCGVVRLSTGMPPYARLLVLSENVGTPTSAVAITFVGLDGSLLTIRNVRVCGFPAAVAVAGGANCTV